MATISFNSFTRCRKFAFSFRSCSFSFHVRNTIKIREQLKKENQANRLEIQKLVAQIEKKDELLSQTQSRLREKDRYISKLIDEDIATLKLIH